MKIFNKVVDFIAKEVGSHFKNNKKYLEISGKAWRNPGILVGSEKYDPACCFATVLRFPLLVQIDYFKIVLWHFGMYV